MNLNVRNFPDELHLRLIEKASKTGYDIKDLVVEAVSNYFDDPVQVTCSLCGLSGPLIKFGTNAWFFHCGAGFVPPEDL